MPDLAKITFRLEIIEARFDIQDLIYKYAMVFDARDAAVIESLFHPDAVLDLGGPAGSVHGRVDIMSSVEELWDALPETHHWISNPVIIIGASRSTSTCAVHAVIVDKLNARAEISGIYADTFERRHNRWAISERRFASRFWIPSVS